MTFFRKCTESDLPQIARLSREWAEEGVTFAYPAAGEEKLAKYLGDYFWVAMSEESGGGNGEESGKESEKGPGKGSGNESGKVIGYTYGAVKTSQYVVFPPGEQYLEIYEVYVHPEYRSGGAGSGLVERIVAEAESHGIRHALVASSNLDWRRTAEFYGRLGFKMWYVQMYR